MRAQHLLSILAILISLATLASAQPPLSDTFALGAIFVNNDDINEHHYLNVKADMPINCVYDALKYSDLYGAGQAGIYIMGQADPNADADAKTYFCGITGLGQWSTAGQYWAAAGSMQ